MHKLSWIPAFIAGSLNFLPEAAGVCRARSASSYGRDHQPAHLKGYRP
jgi:hypothetical protein